MSSSGLVSRGACNPHDPIEERMWPGSSLVDLRAYGMHTLGLAITAVRRDRAAMTVHIPPAHNERSPKETIAIHTDATPPFPKSAKYKVIEYSPQYDGCNSCSVNSFGCSRGTVLPGVLTLIIVTIPFSCVCGLRIHGRSHRRRQPGNQLHQRPRTDRSWR